MLQNYADVTNPHILPSFRRQRTTQASIQAWFDKPHITLSAQTPGAPCILNISIKPAGTRILVINRSSPVISFQNRDKKGLPHGLPQLELRDHAANLAITLPIDLLYAEDIEARLKQGQEVSGSDFQFLPSDQWTNFTFDLNQPLDYLCLFGLTTTTPSRLYHLEVGRPHVPDNVQHWYPSEFHRVETVPIVLEHDSRARLEIRYSDV